MSLQVIIDRVSTFNYGFIEITGGEPLLQVETPILIHDLLDKKYPLTSHTHDAGDDSTYTPFMHQHSY